MFVQQVAKGLVGELLKRLHRLAPEQVERLPGLGIEFHELAPRIGRLLGHDDPLITTGTTIAPDRSSREDAMVREKGAEPQAYPAGKARGGEIILRRAWQRVLFVLGLAVPILALLALLALLMLR
jgi:hypothetical protein